MDFTFSEEALAVAESATTILAAQATTERLHEVEADETQFDQRLWQSLADAGLLGLPFPEDQGGAGLGMTAVGLLLEQVGRHVAPVPVTPSVVMAGLPLSRFGSAAARAAVLPRLVAGEVVLTGSVPEVGEVPAVRANRTEAGWRLSGELSGVPFAGSAEHCVVAARAEGGTVVVLVDLTGDGVRLESQAATAPEPQALVTLDDVEVGDDWVLGGDGVDGADIVDWIRQRTLIALSAHQLGVAGRALEMTTDYTSQREQFGRPIAKFQAVAMKAADAFIDLQAMRWTTWQAAWRLDEGRPAGRAARIAKYWAADGGARVTATAQHLHGGIGVDVDYPLHRYFLWGKQNELRLGGASRIAASLGEDLAREEQGVWR